MKEEKKGSGFISPNSGSLEFGMFSKNIIAHGRKQTLGRKLIPKSVSKLDEILFVLWRCLFLQYLELDNELR